MENRRKIWRKIVEYSSSFWCSHPFGLCVYNYPKLKQQQRLRFWERLALFEQKKKLAPVLVKNRFGFLQNRFGCGKMSHRLWQNQRPTLAKSATDFGKMSHRLSQNQRAISGKSATDFQKMSHHLEEHQPPSLGK